MNTTTTKTRSVATTSVSAIVTILADLGSELIEQHRTPGAVGYTTLTYTVPAAR